MTVKGNGELMLKEMVPILMPLTVDSGAAFMARSMEGLKIAASPVVSEALYSAIFPKSRLE